MLDAYCGTTAETNEGNAHFNLDSARALSPWQVIDFIDVVVSFTELIHAGQQSTKNSMTRTQVQSSASKLPATGTILLVGDHNDVGEWIVEVLQKTTYLVHRTTSPDSIDVPLANVQLAMLIGSNPIWMEQAFAFVKHRTRNLAIMILGPNDFDTKVRLFEIGADAYLSEPFAAEEILARIASLIRIYGRNGGSFAPIDVT